MPPDPDPSPAPDPAARERGFRFLRVNERPPKPRAVGLTEIRGPYYSVLGPRLLRDVLDLAAEAIDSLKFSAGAFAILPRAVVRDMIDLCHERDVLVSTGGFLEYVLTQGRDAVHAYLDECRDLGFDILEISCGFVTIPPDDWLRLVERVRKSGLRAKPEVGIQLGAGGASGARALQAEGQLDPAWALTQAKRLLDAGADLIMMESEGVTEDVTDWRTDVPALFVNELGLDRVMFEAADPEVFSWYVRNYGPDVNLFIDHSQIVQLECLRRGIWGTTPTWGRILTYRG